MSSFPGLAIVLCRMYMKVLLILSHIVVLVFVIGLFLFKYIHCCHDRIIGSICMIIQETGKRQLLMTAPMSMLRCI